MRQRRVACWEMGNIVGSLSFAIFSRFSAFVNCNVMDFRCVSGNESMNRALTNVYDQSPPFPYCNCAKALAEGAQQGSETSQKTGPTTQRVHSVTLPLPMSKLMGEGLVQKAGSAFKEDDRTEPTSCSCTEPL